MKVFFVTAPRANKLLGNVFNQMYEEIKTLGYEHTSNLITLTPKKFEEDMNKGKEAMTQFYQEMVGSISKADICIFEATTSSSGVGYLIDKSLSLSKPTVVLFYKQYRSFLLPGVDDEKLSIFAYDENNYKKILSQALELGSHLRDKRFNFFISPQLLEYLESASKTRGETKSQFIRNLLLEHKKKITKLNKA